MLSGICLWHIISVLPMLGAFLIAQQYFVEGITLTDIKG